MIKNTLPVNFDYFLMDVEMQRGQFDKEKKRKKDSGIKTLKK